MGRRSATSENESSFDMKAQGMFLPLTRSMEMWTDSSCYDDRRETFTATRVPRTKSSASGGGPLRTSEELEYGCASLTSAIDEVAVLATLHHDGLESDEVVEKVEPEPVLREISSESQLDLIEMLPVIPNVEVKVDLSGLIRDRDDIIGSVQAQLVDEALRNVTIPRLNTCGELCLKSTLNGGELQMPEAVTAKTKVSQIAEALSVYQQMVMKTKAEAATQLQPGTGGFDLEEEGFEVAEDVAANIDAAGGTFAFGGQPIGYGDNEVPMMGFSMLTRDGRLVADSQGGVLLQAGGDSRDAIELQRKRITTHHEIDTPRSPNDLGMSQMAKVFEKGDERPTQQQTDTIGGMRDMISRMPKEKRDQLERRSEAIAAWEERVEIEDPVSRYLSQNRKHEELLLQHVGTVDVYDPTGKLTNCCHITEVIEDVFLVENFVEVDRVAKAMAGRYLRESDLAPATQIGKPSLPQLYSEHKRSGEAKKIEKRFLRLLNHIRPKVKMDLCQTMRFQSEFLLNDEFDATSLNVGFLGEVLSGRVAECNEYGADPQHVLWKGMLNLGPNVCEMELPASAISFKMEPGTLLMFEAYRMKEEDDVIKLKSRGEFCFRHRTVLPDNRESMGSLLLHM